jgi:teichuronic acid biosynthesis glycosyltransferase TuaG
VKCENPKYFMANAMSNTVSNYQVAPSSTTNISVVIPAYNAEKYLHDTVSSILNQQGVTAEIIVVDDCSTDATKDVVDSFIKNGESVRYLRTPANAGGPAEPRNIGVHEARTDWIAFCDADDLWHPEKLAVQLALARRSGSHLVCSAIEDFPDGETPTSLERILSETPPCHTMPYWQMLLKDRIATSSVLCRRDVLLESGGFDPVHELVAVEDYDLWLRLMERPDFKVTRIVVPLVAYRRLANSLSANKWRHAKKVMRVSRRAAQRGGWLWVYPLAAPFLFLGYCSMSLYWRVLKGSL